MQEPLIPTAQPYNPPQFVETSAFASTQVIAPETEQRQTYTLEQVQALIDLDRKRDRILNN
jgi:hypothetical protein